MDKVTICIPTYNRADYLHGAIKSALSQTYVNLNVIVADNYSTDNTADCIQEFLWDERFNYYKNKNNIGMVNNWRELINNTEIGEWFIILSDDDYFIDNNYISNAISLIEANPSIAMVYANGFIEYTKTNEKKLLNIPFNSFETGNNVFLNSYKSKPQKFILCNILFNTKIARNLNAFSNVNNLFCDSELFLKMCLFGDVGVIKNPVAIYRFHESNLIKESRTIQELIAIGIDLFIGPYSIAKSQKLINEIDLRRYRKNVVLPEIKNIIFYIGMQNYNKINSVLKYFDDGDGLIELCYRDPIFRLKLMITKYPILFNKLKKFYRIIKSKK